MILYIITIHDKVVKLFECDVNNKERLKHVQETKCDHLYTTILISNVVSRDVFLRPPNKTFQRS